jgi:cyclophilin family peptidyl-prolyl cis-trans isomerase
METSEGSFTIDLDTEAAPRTTNSFAYLVQEGFYDGLGFHRIVPDFVIQGGDPLGDGTGGPGFKTVEQPPSDLSYEPGVVAMARSGDERPGTSGSQFFVVTGAGGASLPPEYALVGTVSEGFDVVEEIGSFGGPDEQPTRTVVIEKATLESS